ncbi:alginate regulatory protein [Clostridium novyi B str. ATCC 27606]|uniref:Alginate regulatory protein n=2 Tax=Clostridium TaxID=1485 RepID=A0AA40ISK9_CLONO|nr:MULTISPECIES: MBOAT family O-acyltransferase [Clostridium]KEI11937.1 alginate regulatory protein [Clostridium novyi B str. NCTC 9691]KEI13477.1 alginate regulatory protein [Clostridium novyi B str. ATCC 27606]KEI17935.1 alginate regulatory protein [Clostridium haemolyticum NCTC 9693]KGN01568.1 alginate regulatory protein [Clostridium haemolyticum NCTC 8350]CAG7839733.1 Peptidoglycan O-acetyltransferase [Clostridium haemolyticum]
MVFSSLTFMFVFLPIILVVYYLSPRCLRNLIIFIASLIFYAWGEPIYILIMIFSTVFDYTNGLLIDRLRHKKRLCRFIFIDSMVINLAILSFFKYYNFIIANINNIMHAHIPSTDLPLPIGISFYTFQTMSYVIDLYFEKVEAQKNIISFGTYVTMFPQLVAGPIVQYGDIAKQLYNRKETLGMFGDGVELFITGLGKKVLLANNIGLLWSSIKATPLWNLSVVGAWIGIIGFTFQIYFDFSGYSDMAMGLAKMFGFNLMKNFNYPYISKSITEFWRRWHISLGSWFRDYVYIPLGGNKKGSFNQYRNLFIVWFLTGLWHGASWNFVLWGLYFGIFVTLEKIFLLKWLDKCPKIISHIYTMLLVIVGWAIFEFEDMHTCSRFIGVMFGFGKNILINTETMYYIYTNWILFMILIICSTPLPAKIISIIKRKIKIIGAVALPLGYVAIMFIATAYLVNDTYNPFLYFKF